MAKRKLTSWIDSFFDYTVNRPSPILMRKWTAISAVGAALERKVWAISQGDKLYPNMYILLITPAGVGKSVCSKIITSLIHEVNEVAREDHHKLHTSPSSVTRAALIDCLAAAEKRIPRFKDKPSTVIEFNSLYAIIDEFGVFLPAYDTDMMSVLSQLWTCVEFKEQKRGGAIKHLLKNPQINLLGGATPTYLADTMPPGAWEQGFMSRTFIIFSSEQIKVDPFMEVPQNDQLYKDLSHDLTMISRMYGEITWSDEAKAALSKWHWADNPPVPDHPKLKAYCARRSEHLLKLCQVASAAVGDSYRIELEHYQTAFGWLLEAETLMTGVFKAMTFGGDMEVVRDTLHFISEEYNRTDKPVARGHILFFVQSRAPKQSIFNILKLLEEGGKINEVGDDRPGIWYEPV